MPQAADCTHGIERWVSQVGLIAARRTGRLRGGDAKIPKDE